MRVSTAVSFGLAAGSLLVLEGEAHADPPPPLVRATEEVAPPPPPPPVAQAVNPPPKERKRWYGWQILALHGVTDAITTGAFFVSYASQAGGLVMTMSAIAGRSIGSWVIESVHDNRGYLPALANFAAPLVGAGLFVPLFAKERKADEDIAPGVGQGLALGAIVGGSLVTAVEASLLFDHDTRPVEIGLSPTGASVRVSF